MKRIFVILFCLAVVETQAATVLTVNWAAATDNGFGLQNGTPLAIGNEIRLGAFDFADNILDAEVRSRLNSGNLVDLLTHFVLFDTAHIGDAFPGNLGQVPANTLSGLFERTSGGVTLPSSSTLFTKQMFLWVFKTTGNDAVTNNFSNVTQTGVFSNNTSAWFFPGDSGNPESRPIELTNLTTANDGTLASTARMIVATGFNSFGTSTTPLATGSNKVFELAPVTPIPEPTSATLLLALLSGASLLRFDRRRY